MASMTTGALALLIAAVLVLIIFLSVKIKTNIGVLAFCFAFLIAAVSGKVSLNGVVNLWPLNTFFLLMGITLFYGYATENGTLKLISDTMIYACRNAGWAIPFAIWIVGFTLSATGSGALASLGVLAPLAVAIAYEAGLHYFPVLVAVFTSTVAGGNSLIAQQGSTMRGYIEDWGGELAEVAAPIVMYICQSGVLAGLLFFIPFYFIFKCHKTKPVNMEKPAAPTPKQRITLIVILFSIVMLIIPPTLGNITGNATIKAIAAWCDIKSVSMICAVLCAFFKVADEKTVIVKRVPWNTLLMVAGVGTLISLANEMGVVDLFADWMGGSVPPNLIAPTLALASGILSLFSGALSVVCPLFFPMVPMLAASAGLNPALLYASIYIGASATGISPLSTGGALILANVITNSGGNSLENSESAMFRNQLIIAALYCALVLLIFYFKIPDIFGVF
ncbi:MAG: hypothetical protein IJ461_10755 [Clostridia bacterium]|nr:hypothetical protein [Clostridia bacterium]